jgi:hypothetical protein
VRIAVSGSHSLGKSTVVNQWVETHPHYIREEEPYRALSLHGPYEIKFRELSTRLHNGIQIYYNISRIHRYSKPTDQVIFDRCPVDYIAYSQYTANQASTDIDTAFVESMVPAAKECLDHLDILAFVPKSQQWPVAMEEDGIRPVDHSYRDEVDTIFKQIYRDGRFDLISQHDGPKLIELIGSPKQRIKQLEQSIAEINLKRDN